MLRHLVDPPGLVALGRVLGWDPIPLHLPHARRLAPALKRGVRNRAAAAGDVVWHLSSCDLGYGREAVLSSVELFGQTGEVTVLMGPNGSGKTTLLRAIAGLSRPLAGRAARGQGRVAYLPQDPGVLLHRATVQKEVEYTLRRAGSDEPAATLLARLGLGDLAERYPGDLSSGQRQRAALAAILAGSPALVLLDEPTRGMDALARRALVELLREMVAAGASAVVSTHDADLAAEVADRIVLVEHGTARDAGDPRSALSGDSSYATDIGRLYPGGPVTVEELMACL